MAKTKKTQKSRNAPATPNDLQARKKEAVLGSSRKKGALVPVLVAVVLVAAIAGGYALYTRQSTATPTVAQPAVPAAADGQRAASGAVTYPVGLFEDGQARHFDFKDGERTIRYFVIKSADGVIRAAFDACDVCWPSGKG